jgi:hypothetical protein
MDKNELIERLKSERHDLETAHDATFNEHQNLMQSYRLGDLPLAVEKRADDLRCKMQKLNGMIEGIDRAIEIIKRPHDQQKDNGDALPNARHCMTCGAEVGAEWDNATVHIDPTSGIGCGGRLR